MITVLLATFNGQTYLVEQLESLLNQTRLPDRIVIQDDHSTDATGQILNDYQCSHPDLIKWTTSEAERGARHNFMSMMIRERDDYVMLCDQDDVWLSDKIEQSLAKITDLEAQLAPGTPCLVHTDLTVVDEALTPLGGSFRTNTFADYDRTTLRDQIIQNTATGCTIIYNRALADLIVTDPPHAVMHDWWISLIAAAFGQIDHLEACTILYRQHTANQVGVTDMRRLSYKLNRFLHPDGVRADIAKTYPQAEDFLRLFADRLNPTQTTFLRSYCQIPTRSKLGRVWSVVRLGVHKTGFSRNVAYLLFV
ncbi:MAG: glycosyltransferase family 2 protein [Propionibacteriaceae bacterium]|jgi:glycosyltransferase involved in cell wall biosynthesis|nr:glycosyltransferase family 2 protein [Propionibacteriaceae bacterium]